MAKGSVMILSLLLGVDKGDKSIEAVEGKADWSWALLGGRHKFALQVYLRDLYWQEPSLYNFSYLKRQIYWNISVSSHGA